MRRRAQCRYKSRVRARLFGWSNPAFGADDVMVYCTHVQVISIPEIFLLVHLRTAHESACSQHHFLFYIAEVRRLATCPSSEVI